MRALMWVFIAVAAAISLLIGLVGCSPTASPPPVSGGCSKNGVCCYVWAQSEFSCVATKIEITVSPGEIKDENLSWNGGVVRGLEASIGQGRAQVGGEVSDRALEGRLLINPGFGVRDSGLGER